MSKQSIPHPYTINVREFAVGPRHDPDPYGATEVTITLRDGTKAAFYTDGLGARRANFYSDYQTLPVLSMEWTEGWTKEDHQRCRNMELKANLRAKRILGIRFDDAESEFNATAGEDPMGPASRYI